MTDLGIGEDEDKKGRQRKNTSSVSKRYPKDLAKLKNQTLR